MESEVKKQKTGLRIFIGVLVGVALCFVVGIVLYSQGLLQISTKANEIEKSNTLKESNKNKEEQKDNSTKVNLYFNSSKVINSTAGIYTLIVPTHATGINIAVDETQTKVTISLNHPLVSQNYGLGWTTALEDHSYEPHDITFDKKVVDVFFGGLGQSSVGDTILFLMEDGTVQYIPVKKAMSVDHENLKTFGILEGVSDVVKFYQANSVMEMGSGITILAQRSDGTIYDLSSILNATGNY